MQYTKAVKKSNIERLANELHLSVRFEPPFVFFYKDGKQIGKPSHGFDKATQRLKLRIHRKEKKVKELNQELYDVLYSEEMFRFLPDFGWMDGGCRSLMMAMQRWLGEAAAPYQIVQHLDQHHSEHALVKVGRYFIDGDALSTEEELVKTWKELEGLSTVIVRPFCPVTEPPYQQEPRQYLPDASIEGIVRLLEESLDKYKVLKILED